MLWERFELDWTPRRFTSMSIRIWNYWNQNQSTVVENVCDISIQYLMITELHTNMSRHVVLLTFSILHPLNNSLECFGNSSNSQISMLTLTRTYRKSISMNSNLRFERWCRHERNDEWHEDGTLREDFFIVSRVRSWEVEMDFSAFLRSILSPLDFLHSFIL